MKSISMRASRASTVTPMQVLAGRQSSGKYDRYTSIIRSAASLRRVPWGRTTPRGPGPLLSGRPRRLITMEETRYPRFLDDPCLHAPLFEPGGPLTPGNSGTAMRPSAAKTASVPQQWSSRGSITRPTDPLCTLRSQDRSWTTQHSVPAGGQPWPVRIRTCWVAKMDSVMSVPLHGFPLHQASPGAISPILPRATASSPSSCGAALAAGP